jgi:hypothetical protein
LVVVAGAVPAFRPVAGGLALRLGFAVGFDFVFGTARPGGAGIFMPGMPGIACRLVSCCAAARPGRRTIAAQSATGTNPRRRATVGCR